MEVWQWVIYGMAVVLALRVMLGIMTAYRNRLWNQLVAGEEKLRREEAARLEAEKEKKRLAKEKELAKPIRW